MRLVGQVESSTWTHILDSCRRSLRCLCWRQPRGAGRSKACSPCSSLAPPPCRPPPPSARDPACLGALPLPRETCACWRWSLCTARSASFCSGLRSGEGLGWSRWLQHWKRRQSFRIILRNHHPVTHTHTHTPTHTHTRAHTYTHHKHTHTHTHTQTHTHTHTPVYKLKTPSKVSVHNVPEIKIPRSLIYSYLPVCRECVWMK